ncbi:MAG: ATP synthase F1 subunit epsilon [Fusobacteriaceae bacterium]|jgi:F-type H+-transporting ATPase subunit epsilon|nr:ATP synthase F1 subunit epsilon [Fusobacteriaceae bacterium]MBP6467733.1 ATP synthase F1 subunit epsilon [Fusobacteriaceae bacterium]MBP9596003.1 ATP synthase F1 subunit epsilon [Fusobacteriaceae bacterium]MBU9917613.1 ATP synthase F1 subunit epsilon [Fusobacteriaceae bacterium]
MATFNLEIITPLEVVYRGEAEFVKLRTIVGDMGILAHHAPLVSGLALGQMMVRNENKVEENFFISGGFLEISKDKTVILADDAMNVKDIDVVLAKREVEELKAKMEKIKEEKDLAQAEKSLQESLMKVQLGQR